MEIFKIIVLAMWGIMLLYVGFMRLSHPIATYLKKSGIRLQNDVKLSNEIRGLSAVMLCSGILVALGLFFPNLTMTTFVAAALVLLAFAIGRLISISTGRKPNKNIIPGIWFEIVLGAANLNWV